MAKTSRRGPRLRPVTLATFAGMIMVCLVAIACGKQPQNQEPMAANVALPAVPLVSAGDKGAFAGSEACRSCHQEQFRQHLLSTHATTLHRIGTGDRFADMFKTDQTVEDPAIGVSYSLAVREGRPFFRARRIVGGPVEEATPTYAVGSGRMGYTFLFERDGTFVESRLSFYPKQRKWYWTAGQDKAAPDQPILGLEMDAQRTRECFLCHSTAVVHQDGLVIPEQSLFQVGCERCHGPGKMHAELARQGKSSPLGPQYGKVGAEAVVTLCRNCHANPGEAGSPSGMDGSLPRFAGTAFTQSKCYTNSNGRLSCITCHEPHQPVKKSPVSYEQVCLGCHAAPDPNGTCPIEPKTGCVDCHMPLQTAGLPLNFKFHNHWIKTRYTSGQRQ